MYAGQRLIASDGYEVCLFPMDYLYCTQVSSPDSYSHCCGHPCDWAGETYTYPVYAPFSGTVTARNLGSAHTLLYTSNAPVHTPSGLSYVTILLSHMDSVGTGTTFTQGDLLYRTGTTAIVPVGDHVHIDQSLMHNADWIDSGIVCEWGYACWMLEGSDQPYDVFYLVDTDTVVILQGMTFQYWEEEPTPTPTRRSSKNWKKFLATRPKIYVRI